MRHFSVLLSIGLVVFLTLAASGCSKPRNPHPKSPFRATDITGIAQPSSFALRDPDGRLRTLQDFKGRVIAVFFGYTHCPDVCPTTLSDFSAALKLLGPHADNVQVLFITLDPARDTPKLLKTYVPSFDPKFIGLYGDAAQTASVAKNFHVFYQKQGGDQDYSIDHTTGTFVFDTQGRLRLLVPYGQRPAWIADDLRTLLQT